MIRLCSPYFMFALLISFAMERGVFIIFLGQMGFSSTQISILQTAFFITCFLAEIPTGMISDNFGRKVSIILGSICMGLGVLLQYIFNYNFYLMLMAFIIHAIAFAFISGAVTALLFDELKKIGQDSKYTNLFSISNFLQGLSLALAMSIGGYIQENYSWQFLYHISALIQTLSLVPVFFMAENKHEKDHSVSFLKGFFQETSSIIRIVLPISFIHAAMTPYFVFSQKYLKAFEISIQSVSHIIAGVEFLSSLIVVFFSFQKIKFERSKTYILLGLFSLLLATHFFAKPTFLWLVSSVIMFLLSNGIILYLFVTSNSYFQSCIKDSGKRASVMSFVSFVDTAAIGIGYLFFGILMDYFPTNMAISFSAVFPVLSILLLWKGRKNVNL